MNRARNISSWALSHQQNLACALFHYKAKSSMWNKAQAPAPTKTLYVQHSTHYHSHYPA